MSDARPQGGFMSLVEQSGSDRGVAEVEDALRDRTYELNKMNGHHITFLFQSRKRD